MQIFTDCPNKGLLFRIFRISCITDLTPNIKYRHHKLFLCYYNGPGFIKQSSRLKLPFLHCLSVLWLNIKEKKRLKMDQFKNVQLVVKNWPNLPNKCIYMGMTYKYSEKGIIGLRLKVIVCTRRCILIAHFSIYSLAVPLGWQKY